MIPQLTIHRESDERRLLFLFSDTGGGHRSTAMAVAEALHTLYGEQAQVTLVNVLADYAPWPLNRLEYIYPRIIRVGEWLWGVLYRLTDEPRRIALLMKAFRKWTRPAVRRLLSDHSADRIVSFHPGTNHLVLRALREESHASLFVTMVTDLVTGHTLWFTPLVPWCLVPTPEARAAAVKNGLPAERVVVTGLPVAGRFAATAQERPSDVRRRLGLSTGCRTVMLLGGAEGMGALDRTVARIAQQWSATGEPDMQIVVIAGRNKALADQLTAHSWPLPVYVRGFVRNIDEWMRAADLLITKAGPSTVSEALVMGLPMVLSGALPGQERPTVDYLVRGGAAIWAPTPGQIARAVAELIANPSLLREMSIRAQAMAQPDAARRVAEFVWNPPEAGSAPAATR